jgi:hypothetical protein
MGIDVAHHDSRGSNGLESCDDIFAGHARLQVNARDDETVDAERKRRGRDLDIA